MGTRVTESGVSVQFCDSRGKIEGPPVFSTYVRVLGQSRDKVFERTGVKETQEEHDFPGSQDWLTLVAIADSEERLNSLVSQSDLPVSDAQTSGASRRVQVELHVCGVRRTLQNRITIASGPVVSTNPPIMNVVHIKVLGEGTVMDPRHPLWEEFKAQFPLPQ